MILDKINNPKDLKALSISEMQNLADEMRELIIKKVNTTGGHLGPNLGFVEATIALHYVFNSPVDKFVFDVSHQSYPHKILTGRKSGFINPADYLKYTGYTAPEESAHDFFKVGHTSTSVSLAVGLAKARDLNNETGNVVAIIGDGSLSGGEAFEGLNNAAILNSNIIILVNDNDMSIAENFGGIYGNFKLLSETKGKAECNFFKAMGFEYHYLENGNCIEKLIALFEKVKDVKKPVVLHIKTLKGKGLKAAETNKEAHHWILPHSLDENYMPDANETNNDITREYLLKKAKTNKNLIAITAGTPGAVGFTKEFRNAMGRQYTDVGIAEQHAVAYASALAKGGAKPVFFVLSSFIQRAYDQLSQDLALNNSPATYLINWCGLSGQDATHLGVFDIPLISNIPNIVYLAPTNKEEYLKMLDWSVEQNKYSVAIRLPLATFKTTGVEDTTDYSVLNKSKLVNKGDTVGIIGVGNFFEIACAVHNQLKKEGINSTLINPVYLTGLDVELLNSLKENHKLIVTLEDGILDGGFGEKVASFFGNSDIKVLNYGAKKEFTDRANVYELCRKYRLIPELIVQDVLNSIKQKISLH